MSKDRGPLDAKARQFIENNLMWLSQTYVTGEEHEDNLFIPDEGDVEE